MEKKLKTKQQLLREVEELRSRLESADRRLKETTDQRQMEEALKTPKPVTAVSLRPPRTEY